MTSGSSRRSRRPFPYAIVVRGAPNGRASDLGSLPGKAVATLEGTGTEMAVPTIACFMGGLRPGDEVEFYVREWDSGGELIIRRAEEDGDGRANGDGRVDRLAGWADSQSGSTKR